MAGLNPGELTAKDLNAVVYRYLTDSAFNFYNEARLDSDEIEVKKIPQGALINVVYKGLRHIEFEVNNEVADDGNFHHFSALDLLTKDVSELAIIARAKPDSVETAEEKKNDTEEKKNDTVKTVEEQKSDDAEDTIPLRIQPARKVKDDAINRVNIRKLMDKANTTEVPNTSAEHSVLPDLAAAAEPGPGDHGPLPGLRRLLTTYVSRD
uniref:LisH domain-containing protein n=1 Tax=Leersia perrieri TaxID=77586 RepID=A0A0D9VWB6_9ORYZ